MEELAQALLGEVEGNSFVGDSSTAIPGGTGSWSGVPVPALQVSSGNNQPVAAGGARRSPSSSHAAVPVRAEISPELAADKRSLWLYRGLGAVAGLLVVAVALLAMQLRTPRVPKGTIVRPSTDVTKDPANGSKDPALGTATNGTDANKPKPGSEPGTPPVTEPTEEHVHSKGDVAKLTFVNGTPVRIKLACVGQKALTVETKKSGLTRLSPSAAKCEATAPGYKSQLFTAAEIRKSVKKGKGKLTVNLVPDNVPNLSVFKKKT